MKIFDLRSKPKKLNNRFARGAEDTEEGQRERGMSMGFYQ
jgi:hypothetical protein